MGWPAAGYWHQECESDPSDHLGQLWYCVGVLGLELCVVYAALDGVSAGFCLGSAGPSWCLLDITGNVENQKAIADYDTTTGFPSSQRQLCPIHGQCTQERRGRQGERQPMNKR